MTNIKRQPVLMDINATHDSTGIVKLALLDIKRQLLQSQMAMLTLFTISGIILVGLFVFSQLMLIPPSDLTRDVVATARLPIYTGFLSTLGILGWTVAVAVCVLGYLLIAKQNRQRIFLLSSAAISAILCLDDMLLLHEHVLAEVFPKAEIVIYGFYVGIVALYLWVYRRTILQTEYVLLFFSLCFFGLSIGMDQILPDLETFVEDSLKFIGVAFWMTYFFRTTMHSIRANQIQHKT